ncbi:hypothetical protein, partial [Moritella viscosa]
LKGNRANLIQLFYLEDWIMKELQIDAKNFVIDASAQDTVKNNEEVVVYLLTLIQNDTGEEAPS